VILNLSSDKWSAQVIAQSTKTSVYNVRHRVQEIGCRPVLSSLFHLSTSEMDVEMKFPVFYGKPAKCGDGFPDLPIWGGVSKMRGAKGEKKKAGLMCPACYYLLWYVQIAVAPPEWEMIQKSCKTSVMQEDGSVHIWDWDWSSRFLVMQFENTGNGGTKVPSTSHQDMRGKVIISERTV
jgi:hypothetical protein